MKRNSLFTKLLAMMLCVMMVVGCLPLSALADANDWESEIDPADPIPGSEESPLTAVIGENNLSDYEDAGDCNWVYTVEYTGTLIVTSSAAITVNGTAYELAEDATEVVVKIDVTAEDEVEVYSESFNLEYEAGSCPEYPYYLTWSWNEAYTEATASVTIPAGETMYFADWSISSSNVITVNGETLSGITYGSPRMSPSTWSITNDGEADAEYAYILTYAEGTYNNPAEAVLGDNAASIAAGTQGYYWNYTAECTGDLVITISGADQWTYVVNNKTQGTYGDTQYSDSDPVVNPTTIAVTAGDVIEIVVNGYDPTAWEAPAANLTINLAYAGCAHANTTTTTVEATCDTAGSVTVTCSDCGEIISTEEIPALGHDYTGENGACINCGEYQVDETLAFYNKAMLLGADIRGIFQVRKIKATSPYVSFKVIVEKGGVESELELVATSDKTNYTTYGYALTVPAKEMADVVNATIIGITADGTYYVSNPDTWSIKEGAVALMDTYSSNTDEASVNKMKLCANMLNYGAEAQKKFNYNLDNLATDGLKQEYADLIITTTPAMETIARTDDTGATAPLKDIVFNLAARVQVLPRFTVPKADSKESYSAVITQTHVAPDGTVTVYDPVTIDGSDCLKSGTTFAVYIDYLATKELRDVMTITLYKDGVAVSETHTFSAESVLSGLMESYPTLIPALMNFCDCARAVFG